MCQLALGLFSQYLQGVSVAVTVFGRLSKILHAIHMSANATHHYGIKFLQLRCPLVERLFRATVSFASSFGKRETVIWRS
jgi:hypothetical protein